MGTSNFHNVNASKIYACSIGENDSRFYDFEELKEQVIYMLENNKNYFEGFDVKDSHELRSYPSNVVGSLSKTKNNLRVTISAVIRSGYYAGANLDWIIEYEENGDSFEKLPELVQFVLKCNEKVKKSDIKWLETTGEKLIKQMESIFAKISDPLVVAARFSNGETMYARAK